MDVGTLLNIFGVEQLCFCFIQIRSSLYYTRHHIQVTPLPVRSDDSCTYSPLGFLLLFRDYFTSIFLLRIFYSAMVALWLADVLFVRVVPSQLNTCFYPALLQLRHGEPFVGFLRVLLGLITRLWTRGYLFLACIFVLRFFSCGCFIHGIIFGRFTKSKSVRSDISLSITISPLCQVCCVWFLLLLQGIWVIQ